MGTGGRGRGSTLHQQACGLAHRKQEQPEHHPASGRRDFPPRAAFAEASARCGISIDQLRKISLRLTALSCCSADRTRLVRLVTLLGVSGSGQWPDSSDDGSRQIGPDSSEPSQRARKLQDFPSRREVVLPASWRRANIPREDTRVTALTQLRPRLRRRPRCADRDETTRLSRVRLRRARCESRGVERLERSRERQLTERLSLSHHKNGKIYITKTLLYWYI